MTLRLDSKHAESLAIVKRPRLLGLDLLRFLAVALVIGRHLPPLPDAWSPSAKFLFLVWQQGGWVGVDLFFVLSGFLVSGLLFTEYRSRGRISVVRFYTRRGWKIYPPFFALIAVTLIVDWASGFPVAKHQLVAELLFLQSYLPHLWGHTWSLAVEEHFYLVLAPVLLVVLAFNRPRSSPLSPIIPLTLCVMVCVLLLRLIHEQYNPNYSHQTHLYPTHLRFDSLFFGVGISYAYHFHTRRFSELFTPLRFWLILCGALLLTPAFAFRLETTPFIFTVGLTLFGLGSGMLLVGVLLSEIPGNRFIVVLATLGTFSYSIYLWHPLVDTWGVWLFEHATGITLQPASGVRIAFYLIGSIIAGVIMARAVELPALRLREMWFPARAAGPIEPRPVSLAAPQSVASVS